MAECHDTQFYQHILRLHEDEWDEKKIVAFASPVNEIYVCKALFRVTILHSKHIQFENFLLVLHLILILRLTIHATIRICYHHKSIQLFLKEHRNSLIKHSV